MNRLFVFIGLPGVGKTTLIDYAFVKGKNYARHDVLAYIDKYKDEQGGKVMCMWIKVVTVPKGAHCTCWKDLVLPEVDYPIGDSSIVNAFSGEVSLEDGDGFIVPTTRALFILARDRGLKYGQCARCNFSDEEHPYMFFPSEACTHLSSAQETEVAR